MNKTVARTLQRNEDNLTGDSVIPFFEMIHFKYKNSFDMISFNEMDIEKN